MAVFSGVYAFCSTCCFDSTLKGFWSFINFFQLLQYFIMVSVFLPSNLLLFFEVLVLLHSEAFIFSKLQNLRQLLWFFEGLYFDYEMPDRHSAYKQAGFSFY